MGALRTFLLGFWVVCLGFLAGCGNDARLGASPTGPAGEAPAAHAAALPGQPIADPALRAALIASRQAEVATDPAYAWSGLTPDATRRDRGDGRAVAHRAISVARRMQAEWLDDGALRLAPTGRVEDVAPRELELQLTRWGGAAALVAVPTITGRASAQNRLELQRENLSEWYVNGPLGLEQGFTIARAPKESSTDLVLELTVKGAEPQLDREGQRVSFVRPGGESVGGYSDLFVEDARGKQLPASLAATQHAILISVDTTGAAYPIEVDPLIWVETKLVRSGAAEADANFGNAVALDGDTAIVGASYKDEAAANSGAAYVFVRSGSGWTPQAKLTPTDGAANDYFGNAVAISGNVAIVGAYADDALSANSGSAYVFTRTNGTWDSGVKLVPSPGKGGTAFGRDVAIDGDAAIVLSTDTGHVFSRVAGNWVEGPLLTAWDSATGFASAVAIDGNIAVIGASGDDSAASNAGSAYVFALGDSGWEPHAKLLPAGVELNDAFGAAVDVDGDQIIVGAPFADADAGSAYVFARDGNSWLPTPIKASDTAQTRFGGAVAIDDGVAVVGAYYGKTGATAGAAYAFVRTATGWTQQPKLQDVATESSDYFGSSVALDEGRALIGSLYRNLGATDSGAVFAFDHQGSRWSERQVLGPSEDVAYDSYGYSVAINGNTAIVGAPYRDSYKGAAWVFVRTGGVWGQSRKLTPSDAASYFGQAVGVSGDLIIVASASAAYVFRRSGNSWVQEQKLTPGDGTLGFGEAVAIDGTTAVVGAYNNGTGAGAAFVFVRSGMTWTQQQKLVPSDAGLGFGGKLALSGDTAIVGGTHADFANLKYTGGAYVFTRAGAVWTQQQKLVPSPSPNLFGLSIALSGETAVVSGFNTSPSYNAAFAFTRSGSTWTQQQRLTSTAPGANLGGPVALVGDLALVGDYAGNGGAGSGSGRVLVFKRAAGVWSELPPIAPSDGSPYDEFGSALAMSGSTAIVANQRDGLLGRAYVFDSFDTALADGSVCSADGQCSSGNCVTGVCCEDACDGACESCLQLFKGDASADGSCGQVASGTICGPPTLECASTTSYKLAPACDPAGDCVARTAACDEGFACVAGGVSGHGYCVTECRAGDPLLPDHDRCAADFFCHASGNCQPDKDGGQACNGNHECLSGQCASSVCKKRQGEQCGGNSECLSGFPCVDGYCCDTNCSGVCEACNLATPGTCQVIDDAAPVPGRCEGNDSQCDGWCDGNSKDQCYFPTTACGAAACTPSTSPGAPAQLSGSVCGGGDCKSSASGNCGDYRNCNAGGTNCATSCTSDAHCTTDAFCDLSDNKCKPDRDVSASCSSAAQCASNFCVDGVCCDTACGEQCEACDVTGFQGKCTLVESGDDPHPDGGRRLPCKSSGGCGGVCDGSNNDACAYETGACGVAVCTPAASLDAAATLTGNVCDEGACAIGKTSSCGLRRACAPAGNDCAATCQFDVECIAGAFCDELDGTCKVDLPVGGECTRSTQCSSLHCVDGFCCNDVCDDACEACNIPVGQQEGGVCTTVPAGGAPRQGACQASHPECGAGKCDGSSRDECFFEEQDQGCGATSCSGATVTTGQCTAKGQCSAGALQRSCGAYVCQSSTECRTGCSSHSHCDVGYRCDFDSGTCEDKLLNGEQCGASEECDSGQCVDGVCCNEACDEQCQACDVAGNEGLCSLVSGEPHGNRPACDAGDHAACAATCNGLDPKCVYPDQGTPCEQASCGSENVLGRARVCDGFGACTLAETQDCGAFRCDADAGECNATCTSDDDCTAGAVCDTTRNLCAFSSATCVDLLTLELADGSRRSCSPFICQAGACLSDCSGDAQCADDYSCTDGDCVRTNEGEGGSATGPSEPPGSAAADAGGCGCRAPGSAPRGHAALGLLVAFAALASRRRRRGGSGMRVG